MNVSWVTNNIVANIISVGEAEIFAMSDVILDEYLSVRSADRGERTDINIRSYFVLFENFLSLFLIAKVLICLTKKNFTVAVNVLIKGNCLPRAWKGI